MNNKIYEVHISWSIDDVKIRYILGLIVNRIDKIHLFSWLRTNKGLVDTLNNFATVEVILICQEKRKAKLYTRVLLINFVANELPIFRIKKLIVGSISCPR